MLYSKGNGPLVSIGNSLSGTQSQYGYGEKKKELHLHWESNPNDLAIQPTLLAPV
jgi:hypothetical protein